MRFVRRSIKLSVVIHYVLEQVFSFLKLSISSLGNKAYGSYAITPRNDFGRI